jgi:hypothetical protein
MEPRGPRPVEIAPPSDWRHRGFFVGLMGSSLPELPMLRWAFKRALGTCPNALRMFAFCIVHVLPACATVARFAKCGVVARASLN